MLVEIYREGQLVYPAVSDEVIITQKRPYGLLKLRVDDNGDLLICRQDGEGNELEQRTLLLNNLFHM